MSADEQKRTEAEAANTGKVLDKRQLKKKIGVTQERIKEIKSNFTKEIDALKKNFKNKDGSVSKKVEMASSLAGVQLSDFVFTQWEDFFKNVGDQEQMKQIQEQRANVAKEMKKQATALKQMLEGGDKEKRTFEVDKKYNYTNSEGDDIEITVKEVGEDGQVKSAEINKGEGEENVTINPYTDKIGKKVEEPQKEEVGKTKKVEKKKVQVSTK